MLPTLQEIMECMRAAFGLPEPEVNIFGLAADLSYGQPTFELICLCHLLQSENL